MPLQYSNYWKGIDMKLNDNSKDQFFNSARLTRQKINMLVQFYDILEEQEIFSTIRTIESALKHLTDAVKNKPSFHAESGEGFSCSCCDMPPLNEEDALNMEVSGLCLVCQHEEDAEDPNDWYQELNSYYMDSRGI